MFFEAAIYYRIVSIGYLIDVYFTYSNKSDWICLASHMWMVASAI